MLLEASLVFIARIIIVLIVKKNSRRTHFSNISVTERLI